ncbi:mitochondrial ribosomal death-associated protein 3-domain-containing protein [Diplogelasinospora grovesii]|uniref:Small ribosomal subunit protein mS29 n=1 Tax=Diplogelasinospora grovesii TaxID=303347 RepID=A0AAN6N5P9_9PEZI|nr:mitochondrial ribosomal death-associated protein 3-domain-containing protein [Diplogelasinospora grovesii]
MATPNCLRCLLVRPSVAARLPAARQMITAAAPFSTTANSRAAGGPQQGKGKKAPKPPVKGKQMNLSAFKKKRDVDKSKPPLPGERKAYRKRILLSNNNALPVPGLQDVNAESMLQTSNSGKVLSLPDAVVDQLRAVEAFKPTQCWGVFRKPSMLVRAETVELMQKMQKAADSQQALRLVVTGDRITGKSMLLLQAMTHAYLNDWVVINVPEAQELTTACTEYAPIPNNPTQYMQQNYVLKMIQAIRKANEKLFSRLTTVHQHPDLPQHVPVSSPLLQLANSAKEADGAWAVFHALWQELTTKGYGRPPILFALDGVAHIMKMSDYRSPAFEQIHSFDLALVRLFADCLGGNVQLPNGGAVLASTSRNNSPRTPSLELALLQREAEQNKTEVPKKDPFFRGYDERVDAVLKSVQVLRLDRVSKAEARAVMEYWAASGVLRATVDEATVSEKWTLGGNGVLGEMERAALLTMRL